MTMEIVGSARSATLPNGIVRLNVIQPAPDDLICAVKGLGDIGNFRDHLRELGIFLPAHDQVLSARDRSPLAQSMMIGNFKVGNRCCIQPMEGWDGNRDGTPSERTFRRWRRFGESGAKLIWGGEAFAVVPEGRANPLQLHYRAENEASMKRLYDGLIQAHKDRFGPGAEKDLFVGLQLTHSGRFCKPTRNDKSEPKIMYHHPLLDGMFKINPNDDSVVLTDREIDEVIIPAYVNAAKMAERIGFNFVDIKACHGYLLHESLGAFNREGKYGGSSLEERANLLRTIIRKVKQECPNLKIGVRLSAFDCIPFKSNPDRATKKGSKGPGEPIEWDLTTQGDYLYGFGINPKDPKKPDLTEAVALLKILRNDGVDIVNITAGSPYYSPYIQRPAFKPPAKTEPSENPLVGVARQIYATRALKLEVPDLPMVGTGYTALQEYLPNVGQATVQEGWVDFVGVGRSVLSYHDLFADVLEGNEIKTNLLCRTLSECTNIIRATGEDGMPLGNSGCLPFDSEYAPDRARLTAFLREHETTI